MDLALNEEHQMVRKMVREFAEKEIAPRIKELDRQQEYDRGILSKLGQQGILGICIPVRYGGAGMDYISLAISCEELERIDTSARVAMSVHVGLNSLTLLQWATEEQKQKYLVPQAMGLKIATYALTEPNAGSMPSAFRPRPARKATTGYSTAKRCGSHSPTWLTTLSSLPGQTPRRSASAITAG
jgi:glutaryl-CoA dehydrogenase (non-decarboxylating)